MNKVQLLEIIEQESLSDDLRAELKQELESYPEELSDQDLLKIDGYLAEIQEMEMMIADAHEQAADAIIAQQQDATNNFVEFTNEVVSVVNSELQSANKLVDSATN